MEHIERSQPTEPAVNVKEFFYLFWSWTWLILLAGILAGATAYLISKRTTPIYQASTSLLVSSPSTISGLDPSTLITTQTMTSTYAEMLLQGPVLQGVIDQLNLKTTTSELKNSISVVVVPNTDLLVVTVEATSPQRASDVANSIASVFTTRISELQSQRYTASSGGLAKQVSDMEQQITTTNNKISEIEQRINPTAIPTTPVAIGTFTAPHFIATTDPGDVAALDQLQAQLAQYRTIYSSLVATYEQVRLSQDQTNTNVVIAEPAQIDSIPVKPKTTQNTVLGFLAGMLLAAGVVYALDALDDTVRNPEAIRKKFDLPILGVIATHDVIIDMPIALAQPRSPTAEAFRSLRTNLTFAAVDRPLRRIMVTSPEMKDGKSTTIANLAVVLAQGEKKVVVVDADLRRPQIHRIFGLNNGIGLSDLFVKPWEQLTGVIQHEAISGLAVITSGSSPPNPAELLSSEKLAHILDQLGRVFDFILVDSPPVLTVTDASALAPVMDGVILVIKPGVTKLGALQQTLEQLRTVNARVVGVVLNQVSSESRKYGYRYSNYSSHYTQSIKGKTSKQSRKKGKGAREKDQSIRAKGG